MALLNAAGFNKETPLNFTLDFQDPDGAAKPGAELIQDEWKRFTGGVVDLKLHFVDQAAITAIRTKRQFQYLQASNSSNIPDPDAWLTDLFHTDGDRTYAGISDPQLDAMIDKQRGILDDKQRHAAIRDIIIYMIDHGPTTLPFSYDLLSAVTPHVHNYRSKGVNIIADQFEQVWLDNVLRSRPLNRRIRPYYGVDRQSPSELSVATRQTCELDARDNVPGS